MITFREVRPDGEYGPTVGTAELTTAGPSYSNDTVRSIMAPMVHRVGPEKAFRFYAAGWTNAYMASSTS